MTVKLTFPEGQTAKMVDGQWQTDDPVLLRHLNLFYMPTDSPADGMPGSRQVQEVQEAFKASAEWIDEEPEVEGRIY